jgi:hypothetical protein
MENSVILFATGDGGATWEATTPVQSPGSIHFNWCFLDRNHGWVSDSARVFVTSDGAATWAEIKPDDVLTRLLQGGYEVEQLSFCDSTNGWGLLRTGNANNATYWLLKTVDGGRSWTDCGAVSGKGK